MWKVQNDGGEIWILDQVVERFQCYLGCILRVPRKPCCPEDFFLSLAKSFLWIFRSMHNFRVHFELLPLQIPGIEPSSSQVERFVKITTAILLPELLPDGCFKKSYKTGSNCEKCMRGRIRPAKSEL